MYKLHAPEVFDRILDQIATTTRSLADICSEDGMPDTSTIVRRLQKDDEFRVKYEAAKATQMELMAEEIISIADESAGDDLIKVNRDKLRIDARKWAMSKLAPKRFGDNRNVNVDVGVRRVTSAEQMIELRGAIMQKLDASKVEDIEHEDL